MRLALAAVVMAGIFFSVGCTTMQTQANDCPPCQQKLNVPTVTSPSGMFGPITCSEQQQAAHHCYPFACMWGRLVSDGFGGTMRVYGYPKFGCNGNRCCVPDCQ